MQSFLDNHPALARMVRLRMADWVLIALVLWGVVALLAPQQLPVSIYKMSLVALAAVMGYWIDRSVFPYARPDQYLEPLAQVPDTARETAFTDLAAAVYFSEGVAPGLTSEQAALLGRAAMLRRALIVAATMLAVSLGA